MISSPELAVCLLVPLASCWLVHQLGWRLFHLGLTEFAVGLACAMGLLALTAYTEAAAASGAGEVRSLAIRTAGRGQVVHRTSSSTRVAAPLLYPRGDSRCVEPTISPRQLRDVGHPIHPDAMAIRDVTTK